jgi:transposase
LAADKSKYERGVEERTVRRLSLAEKLRVVNLARHYGPGEAARQMEVDRQTVYLWLGRYEEGGSEALRSLPRGKQEPRTVTPEVKARLLALKEENPKRSSPKVARLYEEESGLRVHRTTVWAVLKKGGHQSSP